MRYCAPLSTGKAGPTLVPISKIRTEEEATLEHLREDLRDRRWARHKQQLRYLVFCAGVVAPASAFQVLERLSS